MIAIDRDDIRDRLIPGAFGGILIPPAGQAVLERIVAREFVGILVLDEKTDFWLRDCTWREYYSQCVFSVSYRPFITDKIIKNRQYKFEGYVAKRTIAAFEANDIECVPEWLTDTEYKALSEKSRRQYSFYQWNEYGDNYDIYTTIVRRIETLLYAYDYGYDRSFKYDEYFYDPKIRLIVEQSG